MVHLIPPNTSAAKLFSVHPTFYLLKAIQAQGLLTLLPDGARRLFEQSIQPLINRPEPTSPTPSAPPSTPPPSNPIGYPTPRKNWPGSHQLKRPLSKSSPRMKRSSTAKKISPPSRSAPSPSVSSSPRTNSPSKPGSLLSWSSPTPTPPNTISSSWRRTLPSKKSEKNPTSWPPIHKLPRSNSSRMTNGSCTPPKCSKLVKPRPSASKPRHNREPIHSYAPSPATGPS